MKPQRKLIGRSEITSILLDVLASKSVRCGLQTLGRCLNALVGGRQRDAHMVIGRCTVELTWPRDDAQLGKVGQ